MRDTRTMTAGITTMALMVTLIVLVVSASGPAVAQAPESTDPLQQQHRLEAQIRAAGDLTEPQRSRMQEQLQECRRLGLGDDDIAPLFPGNGPNGPNGLTPETALQLQAQVIRAARGETPVEPLLAKIREGRMKGAPDDVLLRTATRVTDDLLAASALLAAAAGDGLAPAGDQEDRRVQVRTMTRAMWRGLTPEDGDHLRVRARERLRNGTCTTGDFAAAAETLVRLREQGGGRAETLHLVGAALANGYAANDLAELGRAVTSGRLAGGDVRALLGELSGRMDAGMDPGALNRYMQQSGWMGPADVPGAGGRPDGGHQGDGPGGSDGGPGTGTGGGGASDGGRKVH
jgi:hypothetical protein